MNSIAAEGRQLDFQLLSSQISISYQDPSLDAVLAYISVDARQSVQVTTHFSYRIPGYGPYEVFEEGDLLEPAGNAEDVQFHLYRRCYGRTLERYELSGWVVLHAGLVDIDGTRILLLGDKGAGKTSLMTRLMLDGHGFQGDELVMVQPGRAIAVPRLQHVKPGADRLFPDLRNRLETLPLSRSGDLLIRALGPGDLGREWNITPGPIDRVVVISPNHSGATRLEPVDTLEMTRCLIEGFMGWGESKSTVIRNAASLAGGGGHRLVLGDPESGAAALESLARKNSGI